MALRQRAAKKTALPLGADDNDDVDWKPALPSMRKRTRLKVGGQNLWTRVYLPVMWGIILLVGCTHFFLGGHKAVPYDRHLSSRKLMSQHDIDTGSFDKLHQQRKELDLQKEQFVRERKKEEEYFKQERERLRMEKIKQKEELERELKDLGKKEKKKVGGLAIPSNNRYVSKEQLADNQYHPSSEIDHANTAAEKPREWTKICQGLTRGGLGRSKQSILSTIDKLTQCAEKIATAQLVEMNQEIAYQSRTRLQISGAMENYTCDDPHAPMSPDVSTHKWIMPHGFMSGNVTRTVHVKHDRPASQIHVVENFVDDEECQAMEDEAKKSLHRATVADGKGGSRVSDNRKAMQAGIRVPWYKEKNGHPIARLSRRVYDYTNHVLGLDIDEHGQEDLMSIQYFGRGKEDEHPDRYMPHCDGDCSGLPHKQGTRMATMVIYCKTPPVGGSTNFRNAGVHVKPTKGAAVFFSYINPITRVTDERFTEHSGCPVYEGEKKIVTQWVRLGVDRENPWTSFNTLGIKIKDAKNQ